MQNQMEIFYDKYISLDLWENIYNIIKGVGTSEWEKYWTSYITSSDKINSLIDYNSHLSLT